MKTTTLIATAVLASAALTTPTVAQELVQQTIVTEVPINLNNFVGQNVFGAAHANLGTVSRVDPYRGVIALTGRYGEYALISMSLLIPNGLSLRAPTLSQGDIKYASDANLRHPGATMTAPHIIVVEPPLG